MEVSEDFSSKVQKANAEQSPPCDSERSTVTDDGDSMKVEEETAKNLETNQKQGVEEEEVQDIEGVKTQYSSSSLYAKLANNKKEKDKDKDLMGKEGKISLLYLLMSLLIFHQLINHSKFIPQVINKNKAL